LQTCILAKYPAKLDLGMDPMVTYGGNTRGDVRMLKNNRTEKEGKRQPDQQDGGKRKNKSLEEWNDLVTQRIEEAIERGDFDNLPGKGKPLNLETNPNEPAEVQMAHRLLKNNELAPSWMLDRRRLLDESEALRAQLQHKWRWYSDEYAAEEDATERALMVEEWAAWLILWEEAIVDLNRRILDLNLSLPIWRMELLRLNLDRELTRVGARRNLGTST
jgi:DnaJ homolog subfamily C member 28